jgi:hypothetical protein
VINRHILTTLILISALGAVAIPFGNPKFIGEAIIVELSFITLSVLVWRGYTKALYACIALALTVIIGNSTGSYSFNDNFFKASQCINSNNWWIRPSRNLNLY